MFEKLILYYAEHFHKNKSYLLLRSSVCIEILSGCYKKWVEKEGYTPIEELTTEQKNKFLNLAMTYHEDKEKRLMAAKAAYALELMMVE